MFFSMVKRFLASSEQGLIHNDKAKLKEIHKTLWWVGKSVAPTHE